MDEDEALAAQATVLLRQLEDVLAGARARLDALVRDVLPVQQSGAALARPETGSDWPPRAV